MVISLLVALLVALQLGTVASKVTYDHKAIVINGQRRILFSGSIHYPRSTPEVSMWINWSDFYLPFSVDVLLISFCLMHVLL